MMISVTDVQSTYSSYNYTTSGVMKGADETSERSTSSVDVTSLGKDDFLKLLLAELQHQDPLNPADNTEFVAQLAQFSSLEQMTQMNESLQLSLENNNALSESINNAMMVNYFGKEVATESNAFMYDGGEGVEFQFVLEEPAIENTIRIVDQTGYTVRHVDIAAMEKGVKAVEWDGLTDRGVKAPEGVYTFEFEGTTITGQDAAITPIYSGRVEGIVWRDGRAHLSIGGVLVPFDKVTGITDPTES